MVKKEKGFMTLTPGLVDFAVVVDHVKAMATLTLAHARVVGRWEGAGVDADSAASLKIILQYTNTLAFLFRVKIFYGIK